MDRVDKYCHFWGVSPGDYDWLDVNDPTLSRIARDFGAADLAPQRAAANVNHLVVVQAAATEAETDYLLALVNRRR